MNELVPIQSTANGAEAPSPALDAADATEFARLCAEHGADGLVVLDRDGKLIWQNRAFEKITGFSIHDFLGKAPRELLVSEKTDPAELQKFKECYEAQIPFSVELEFRRKNGEDFWLEINVTPIFDVGSLRYFVTSSRETTMRRHLRQQHENSLRVENSRKQERRMMSHFSEWLYSAKSIEEILQVIQKSLAALMPETSGQLFVYAKGRDSLELSTSWGASPAQHTINADDCWALRRGRAYSYGTKMIEFPCNHLPEPETNAPYFCVPIMAHGQTNGLLHVMLSQEDVLPMPEDQRSEFIERRRHMALACAEQISLALANVQLRQEISYKSAKHTAQD